MSFVIPRKREHWQRKPSGPSEINYGSGAARDIAACYLMDDSGRVLRDIALGSDADLRSSSTVGEGELLIPSASDEPNNGATVTGSSGVGHALDFVSDFTFISEITATSAYTPDDFRAIFAKRSASGFQYHFRIKDSGVISLLTTGGSVDASFNLPLNKKSVVSVSSDSSGRVFQLDGATEAADFKSISYVNTSVTIGTTQLTNSTNLSLGGTIHRIYAYSRKLCKEELLDLEHNPYQILKPRRSYWQMPSGVTPPQTFKPAWAMASRRSGLIGAR